MLKIILNIVLHESGVPTYHEWDMAHLIGLLPKFLFIYINLCSTINSLEVPLTDGWFLRNNNRSENLNDWYYFRECFTTSNNLHQSIGIQISGEILPSGVYSALENAKIVDSVVNSFNDVNLRWIARDVWTYSLKFDSK